MNDVWNLDPIYRSLEEPALAADKEGTAFVSKYKKLLYTTPVATA